MGFGVVDDLEIERRNEQVRMMILSFHFLCVSLCVKIISLLKVKKLKCFLVGRVCGVTWWVVIWLTR